MITLTRQEFIQRYKRKPGELFDLTRILTNEHRKEALQYTDPKRCLVRMEFGTIAGIPKIKLEPLIYALEVNYWSDAGRFQASIQKVIVFDSQAEQDLYKAHVAAESMPFPFMN